MPPGDGVAMATEARNAHAGETALFVPVDLQAEYNAAPEAVLRRWYSGQAEGFVVPRGEQRYWGIPFVCAPASASTAPCWIVAGAATTASFSIPLAPVQGRSPSYLTFLHVCA